MVLRRYRRGIRKRGRRARRDLRDAGSDASSAGDAHGHGVLGERQVHLACVLAEPELSVARDGRVHRHSPGGSRLHRGVLRRRFRLEGRRLSVPGHRGADVAQDRPARDDADQPPRGELHRLGAAGLPGPNQDGVRRRRALHGGRPLHRAGKRRDDRFQRLALGGRRRFAGLFRARDAFSGYPDSHEHPAARPATRPGPESDRHGRRAAPRQGGRRARYRSAADPPDQCDEQRDALRRQPVAGHGCVSRRGTGHRRARIRLGDAART